MISSSKPPFFTRLAPAFALLVILFVPNSIGTAQTNLPRKTATPDAVVCPDCCASVCRTGWWYMRLQMCFAGGNGSCMHCDTTCGIPDGPVYPDPEP